MSSVFKGGQMPSINAITTIGSPKGVVTMNNSIEKINKGITDSINKGNKEF